MRPQTVKKDRPELVELDLGSLEVDVREDRVDDRRDEGEHHELHAGRDDRADRLFGEKLGRAEQAKGEEDPDQRGE